MIDFEFYREMPWIGGALLLLIVGGVVIVGKRSRRTGGAPWLTVSAVLLLGAIALWLVPFLDLVLTCLAAGDCV